MMRFFMLSVLFGLTLTLQAQNISMLCDGRSWKYEYSVIDWSSMTEEQIMNGDYSSCGRLTYNYELRVEGDVMFDGRQCKSIIYDGFNGTGLFAYGYEEDGCVIIYVLELEPAFYARFPMGKWETLYDFNVEKDSHCQMGAFQCSDMIANTISSVKVDGVDRKYLVLGDAQNPTSPLRYAVEGIGSAFGLYEFENLNTNGSSSRFVGCYDGESCVLSAEDFKALTATTTGFREEKRSNCYSTTLCDLQGRRITAEPQRGLYIRDGKKYVVK